MLKLSAVENKQSNTPSNGLGQKPRTLLKQRRRIALNKNWMNMKKLIQTPPWNKIILNNVTRLEKNTVT